MASEYTFGKHDAKSVTTSHRGLFSTMEFENRWIEQFHGRHPSLQKEEPYRLECAQLVHFTSHQSAMEIGNFDGSGCFGFKFGGWSPEKKKSDNSQKETIRYLSWWVAFRPNSWRSTVEAAIPDLKKKYQDVLGNSAAFDGYNEYGPIGFVVSWRGIREAYAKLRGCHLDEVELRVLGTFRYTAEIMYAILVCRKKDKFKWNDGNASVPFPPIPDGGTEAFECLDSCEKFLWKAYSTIGYGNARPRLDGIRWSWDNLSFAFYCPQKDGILEIPADLFNISDKIGSSRNWKPYNLRNLDKEEEEARKVVKRLKEKNEVAKIEKVKMEKTRIQKLSRNKKLRILY